MKGNHSAARRSVFSGEKVSLCWFPRSLTSPPCGRLLGHSCSQIFTLLCSPTPKHMDLQMILQLHSENIIPVISLFWYHTSYNIIFVYIPPCCKIHQQPLIIECLFSRSLQTVMAASSQKAAGSQLVTDHPRLCLHCPGLGPQRLMGNCSSTVCV